MEKEYCQAKKVTGIILLFMQLQNVQFYIIIFILQIILTNFGKIALL